MIIELKEHNSLLNLDNVRQVIKVGGGMDRAAQYSYIRILYTDNSELDINYGNDDRYTRYDTTNSGRRDKDYLQIADILVKSNE